MSINLICIHTDTQNIDDSKTGTTAGVIAGVVVAVVIVIVITMIIFIALCYYFCLKDWWNRSTYVCKFTKSI